VDFEIGFWHPFGPHARERPEDIIVRKRAEIQRNCWTLWSFQYRRMQTLEMWYRTVVESNPTHVLVICSKGNGVDPAETLDEGIISGCRSYRFVSETEWRPLPRSIEVPHPFKAGKTTIASASLSKASFVHLNRLRRR